MISVVSFGKTKSGAQVDLIRVTARSGAFAEFISYGAAVKTLAVADKSGRLTDVVLGYDSLREYEENDGYFGAAIGRVANRIGGAEFVLGGKKYSLFANDGPNSLHGGKEGFDKKVWGYETFKNGVEFTYISPDGEEGYPGTLTAKVRYTFDGQTLSIKYTASCDEDTVASLTNHAYFNLSGQGSGTVLDHYVQLEADEYTEVGEGIIATGRLAPVKGTPLDFTAPHKIEERLGDPFLIPCGGYDHNYVVRGHGMRKAAYLYSEKTGIELLLKTDLPGLQLYSGNFMTDRAGKLGCRYGYREGLCLETQFFPNTPNRAEFPSCVIKKGETFISRTEYAFSAK